MSEKNIRVGQRVEVAGKDVRGRIAYIGMAAFASGKWVGVVLDEPKGKNNGSVKGHSYFACEENHGMFVRPSQLVFLDDAGNPIEEGSPGEKPTRSRLSGMSSSSSSSSYVRSVTSTKPTTSRLSLAGSRQSLAGSRSQLASPGTDRPSAGNTTPASSMSTSLVFDKVSTSDLRAAEAKRISPPEMSMSKRASFVETGFVETLKPTFVAGASLTSLSPAGAASAPTEDKLTFLQIQHENEDLRVQVHDLTEKLETLRQRRSEDKERLRDFDKMKTQFEQLQEFKSKIMEAQSQLQRDLQRARQDAKDAVEARDRHAEEMADIAENVELITLDKEMAEEKAETLQLELETARERIEEITLDLEILKQEVSNRSGGGQTATTLTPSNEISQNNPVMAISGSSYEFKQLEQQNTRLRDTLVRLRDLSAHEKHEIQKMSKELDTKKSEVAELQRTKEKLSAKVEELETQFVELQEQVDAALGAEEMVEQLADKKMELEDKVKSLEEMVTELEELEEVHEQLVESNHELELDMREELDMAHSAKRDAIREKDAAMETILDRDQTIFKFRELVQRLNDQMQDLRERATSEESNTSTSTAGGRSNAPVNTPLAETIDFKQMFAESKAYTRAIDLQLRQIELQQANEHVRYLVAYMPDTFMARGSDHDAIQITLLVGRLAFKSDIIVSQTRERFPPITTCDRTAILQGHTVHQFAFRSRLLHYVHNLQAVMHQFLYGLNVCKPDILLNAGASLPEMIAQEKTIDNFVELLKANQLDENSSTENLEKCVAFFNAMYGVLLGSEDLSNETQIIRDSTAAIGAACDSVGTDAALVQALITAGDETSSTGLLLQYIVQNCDTLRQHLKLIKRRMPQDSGIIKCGMSGNRLLTLKQCTDNMGKLMAVMSITAKQVLNILTLEGEPEPSISHQKLSELMSMACDRVYEQDDRGPSQNIRTVISTTNTDMVQLAQYLLDNEYEIISGAKASMERQTSIMPLILRAQHVKKQLEETKTLTATLENRDAEIRQLKMSAKMKQNELSEMQIRKDLAEKKLSVLQQDHEINTEKLQRKCEETAQLLKKKEKEFEETMDHLQSDIDSLESERGALREKLKGYSSKKGDLKSSTAFDITASSPFIAQELCLLKKAFTDERTERIKLQANEFRKVLGNLEPIHVPQPKDNRIIELESDLAKVKYDWVMSLANGAEYPVARTVHANAKKLLHDQKVRNKIIREDIKSRAENIASDIMNEYLNRKPYRSVQGDFCKFPSVELLKALR